jgi:flagellar basal-body rod protein FlgG
VQPGITVPGGATAVTIAADGTVSASISGQAAPQTLGQLQLASFINPAGLEPRGGNIYGETAASGTPNAGAPGSSGLGGCSRALSKAATSTSSRSWSR